MEQLEKWLPVVGYEGLYEVSDIGNVRSFPKTWKCGPEGNTTKFHIGMTLKPYLQKMGYLCVSLRKGNKANTHRIHRLMGFAFLELTDDLYVDHINGIRHDNRLDNLRVCTNRENTSSENVKRAIKPSSKYLGVYWNNTKQRWMASIYIDGKNKRLGTFKDEISASLAYQSKLKSIN